MALRGPKAVFTTLTCPVVGAKQAIAACAAGAPTAGFINSQSADTNGFGFSGKLRAATGNTGTISIECQIPDSNGDLQTYTAVLAATEETPPLLDVDLHTIIVYGSVASQKLHVLGSQ